MLIGVGRVNTTRDVLHLEATVVSVQRFNVRVRCGHTRNGTSPLILPDALLSVLAPTDADADRMTTTAAKSSAGVKSGAARPPSAKPPGKTAAPKPKPTQPKPTQPKPTQPKAAQPKPAQPKPTQPASRQAGSSATKP